MNDSQSSFRKIIKGTAIFGGTQLITMLTNIVRGKLVAIILGSYGMGLSALIMSIINPIVEFFSFGIPMASVSSIANTKDKDEIANKIIACRRCVLILAILACLFTVSFSGLLSSWTFGSNGNKTLWVVFSSFAVLFMIMNSCENAILQSLRELRKLAKCNIVAPICSLIIGVPIYFFFGVDGIVPSLIIQSLLVWTYTRWNTSKLGITADQSWAESIRIGKVIIILGGTMMISGLFINITNYLINLFVNNYGNTHDVGFYQGATSITTQCVSLVFTALATDYYPHLSQVCKDRNKMNELVNQEGEIVILIMAIVTASIIVFAPFIVRLLLTSEFLCIIPVIQLIVITFLFKAFYFPLGYIVYARGDKMFYIFISGLLFNAKYVLVAILCYKQFGLIGLGYAIAISEVIDMILISLYMRVKYNVSYSARMHGISLSIFAICAVMFYIYSFSEDLTYSFAINIALLTSVVLFSIISINRRINIISFAKERFLKKKD